MGTSCGRGKPHLADFSFGGKVSLAKTVRAWRECPLMR